MPEVRESDQARARQILQSGNVAPARGVTRDERERAREALRSLTPPTPAPIPRPTPEETIAKGGSALEQLGSKRVGQDIYTFEQALSDPEVKRKLGLDQPTAAAKENVELIEKRELYGISKTVAPGPAIAYDPAEPTSAFTIAHEAGHIGAAAVRIEAGGDPNIFKRYAFRKPPGGGEEERQRALDVSVAKRLEKTGAMSPADAETEKRRALDFLQEKEPLTAAKATELLRHERMYEEYARKILRKEESELDLPPMVNGNGRLDVDVKAPTGVNVKAEGEGLFNKTETNRQNIDQLEPVI